MYIHMHTYYLIHKRFFDHNTVGVGTSHKIPHDDHDDHDDEDDDDENEDDEIDDSDDVDDENDAYDIMMWDDNMIQ